METIAKKRILFVDDELRILQSLERLLRPYRRELEATFANGGEAALAIMNACPFDILVTDIRMPKVDGIAVLQYAKAQHPHMIRIALSGQTDLESMIRSACLAHQFLAKPCGVEMLRDVINRIYDLYQQLRTKEMRIALASLGALPSLPVHYYELNEKLSGARVNREEIISLIERDVGMLSKLLQIVNSPVFGASKPIVTARDAVFFVDLQMLRELLLVGQVFEICETPEANNFSVLNFYRHSLLVGSIASALVHTPSQAAEAFTAGMLHDVGMLVLATRLPSLFEETNQRARQRKVPFYQAEERPATHALIGAALFSLWGLPYSVIEAVARHHEIESLRHREFGVLDAVYVSQLLVAQLEQNSQEFSELDDRYLRRVGVWERLPRWRELAKTREASISQGLPI
jgi:HD-like signal output (HDOD) protein